MCVGFILVLTSLSEIWGTIWSDLSHFRFRVHHGVILYGLYTILRSIADLHEGLEHLNRKKDSPDRPRNLSSIPIKSNNIS